PALRLALASSGRGSRDGGPQGTKEILAGKRRCVAWPRGRAPQHAPATPELIGEHDAASRAPGGAVQKGGVGGSERHGGARPSGPLVPAAPRPDEGRHLRPRPYY